VKSTLEPLAVPLIVGDDKKHESALRERARAALTQAYDEHFDFVWRNARRLGVPEDSADDVAQEVFIVVHRRFSSFDGRSSMRAWIFGILVRVVSDYHRTFRRKGSRHVSLDVEVPSDTLNVAAGTAPMEWEQATERRFFLEKLLAALDEDKRAILILAELEQWTLREIAELYGSNTSTIHCRLKAAKHAAEQAYVRLLRGKKELP
jgi:RNA polymerase sigma-70 factor (ECF subfamily)